MMVVTLAFCDFKFLMNNLIEVSYSHSTVIAANCRCGATPIYLSVILLASVTVDLFGLLNLLYDRLLEDATMRRSYDGLLWTLRYVYDGVQVLNILNLQQVPSYICKCNLWSTTSRCLGQKKNVN